MTPLQTRIDVILTAARCRGAQIGRLCILAVNVYRAHVPVDALYWFYSGASTSCPESPLCPASLSLYHLLEYAQEASS